MHFELDVDSFLLFLEALVPAVPILKTDDGEDAGIPILGENKSIQIMITESKEFKVSAFSIFICEIQKNISYCQLSKQ